MMQKALLQPISGSQEQDTALKNILSQYRDLPGGFLPALQQVQLLYGYLPDAALEAAAEAFSLPLAEVWETVSFYSLLNRSPKGETVLHICSCSACALSRSGVLKAALEQQLGIRAGETTADGKYTLLTCGCLGACDRAPAIMVNGVTYGPVSIDDLDGWLACIRKEVQHER